MFLLSRESRVLRCKRGVDKAQPYPPLLGIRQALLRINERSTAVFKIGTYAKAPNGVEFSRRTACTVIENWPCWACLRKSRVLKR